MIPWLDLSLKYHNSAYAPRCGASADEGQISEFRFNLFSRFRRDKKTQIFAQHQSCLGFKCWQGTKNNNIDGQ